MPKRSVTPAEWFAEKVPGSWLAGPPEVSVDAEEVVVVLPLAEGAGDVRAFRAATKDQRMAIAAAAQDRFGRTVSWGVRRDGVVHLYTHLAVPAMTRLRQPERQVLDTLVAGGVARSRSEALAWCVRHVAETEGDWLAQLREALQAVDEVRRDGPKRARGGATG